MHRDDATLGEALRAGELNVVEQHGLAHAAAGEADDEGELEQGEIDRRQDQMLDPGPGGEARSNAEDAADLATSGGGEPAEPDGEDHDQHHALPEVRQAEAEDR